MNVLSFGTEQEAIDALGWIDSNKGYPNQTTNTWDEIKKHATIDKWYICTPEDFSGVVGYQEEEVGRDWYE